MRLLFLTPTAIFSGGERVTLDIAVAMRGRGHEVSYCGLEGSVRTFVEEAGVPFIPLAQFTPQAVRSLARELRPDIIHAMDFRASLYAALSGIPFIAHLHNNPPWLRRYGINSLATLFFGRRAGKVLVVSKSVLEGYIFAGAIADNVQVLGNTVNIRAVREQSRSCYFADGYDVGFMGRLTEQKQPLAFIDIVARLRACLPEVRVLLIGEGELRPKVERAIAAKHLEQCVTLAGFLTNPFPAVAGCKVIIMPSAWEGFGLTAVESMALGKPVLASPVGGLKDIVNERCGKLCASEAEFASEALLLLSAPEIYERKSRAAMERAEQYNDRFTYYNRIEEIYTSS